jgi:hypothetical protein
MGRLASAEVDSMRPLWRGALLAVVLVFANIGTSEPAPKKPRAAARLTDQQLRQMVIEQSIKEYRGSCPCPYSVDRAGRSCGARSAWSRPGGAAPYCFPKDVPQEEVDRLRASLTSD